MATAKKCLRCDGTGHIPGFNHVMGGVCFRCGGSGKILPPNESAVNDKRERDNANLFESIENLASEILELKARRNIFIAKPASRINSAAINLIDKKIVEAEGKIIDLRGMIK